MTELQSDKEYNKNVKTALIEILENDDILKNIAKLIKKGEVHKSTVSDIITFITGGTHTSDIEDINDYLARLLSNSGFVTGFRDAVKNDEIDKNIQEMIYFRLERLKDRVFKVELPNLPKYPYHKELSELHKVLTLDPVETLEGVLAAVHTFLRETDLELPNDKRKQRYEAANEHQYREGLNFDFTKNKENQITFMVGENNCAIQIQLDKKVIIFMDIDTPSIMLPVAY